jgi:formyl-CoA transferase
MTREPEPDMAGATPPGPLHGIRVLELGTLIAGPFAGRILADFGADVVKVEHPAQGDPLRGWGGRWNGRESLWHLVQSRGKRSVAADLHEPGDQALVRALALESDILVENFRPGRLEAWNLDPEDLQRANPALIVVRISGYGQTGPLRDQPGFGTIAEAAGGLRHLTGDADRPPARVGLSLGDSVASLHAVIGALIALHERHASGRGQVVDVALTEAVFSLLEGVLPEFSYLGRVRERVGNIAHNSAPTNAYRCRDGTLVCIAANTTALFRALFRTIGRPDIADDPALAANRERVRRAGELDAAIGAWTDGLTAGEVVERLRAERIPVSRINSIADIVADPQFQARDMLVEVRDDRLGKPLLVPGVVPRLSRTPGRVPPLGRALGQDTAEIRRWLERTTPASRHPAGDGGGEAASPDRGGAPPAGPDRSRAIPRR